jgi:hypothetical protein
MLTLLRTRLVCSSLVLVSTLTAASCASNTDSADDGSASNHDSQALTADDAVSRAEQWVAAQLHYCQAPNHHADGDRACSSVCSRTNNAAWDPYRSDCSGLISWAWKLPPPGLVTTSFAPFSTGVSHVIPGASLAPGDAINNADHVMLFKKWLTRGMSAVFIEEPGCSANPPHAREYTATVSMSGSTVTVAGRGSYTAIRYKGIAAGSSSSSGTGSHTASDVDGDGRSDLVAVASGHAYVYPGSSGAAFTSRVDSFAGTLGDRRMSPSSPGWNLIGVADVTGDGHADLVGLHSSGTAMVWPGETSGAFGASVDSFAGTMGLGSRSNAGFDPIGLGDVTGDGHADLVAAHTNGELYVFPGSPAGSFGASVASVGFDWALHDPTGHWPVGVADVTGDGRGDLVTLHSNGTAYVYAGRADGHFEAAVASFAGTMHPSFSDGRAGHEPIGLGDVNGDGHADLVTLANGTANVYLGTASGTFAAGPRSFGGTMGSARFDRTGFDAAAVIDVTGDGHADLISAHQNGDLYVYPGQSSGAFGGSTPSFSGTFSDTLFHAGAGFDLAIQSLSVRRATCGSAGCSIP